MDVETKRAIQGLLIGYIVLFSIIYLFFQNHKSIWEVDFNLMFVGYACSFGVFLIIYFISNLFNINKEYEEDIHLFFESVYIFIGLASIALALLSLNAINKSYFDILTLSLVGVSFFYPVSLCLTYIFLSFKRKKKK